MHKTSGNAALGFTLALTTATLWGILPIFLKLVLEKMDTYTITWYRFFIAALILSLYLGLKGHLPNPFRSAPLHRTLLLVAGLCLCGNYISYLTGLDYISAETAQVVIQTAPFLMMLGGIIIFRENFSPLQKFGALLLFSSLTLFFNERLALLFSASSHYAYGVFWVLLGAVAWAAYALSQKQLLLRFSSMQIMLLIYVMGSIIFFPLATPAQALALDTPTLIYLLFCCLNTLVAYGAFAEALAHWEASKVSAVLATTPIATIVSVNYLALVWGFGPMPDNLNWLAYAGAAGVVAGSATIAIGKAVKYSSESSTTATAELNAEQPPSPRG